MLQERDPGLRQRQREVDIDNFPDHPHLYYEEKGVLFKETLEFVSKWLANHAPEAIGTALADKLGQEMTLREAAEKWGVSMTTLQWYQTRLANAIRRMQ